jgi:hypothetical protein
MTPTDAACLSCHWSGPVPVTVDVSVVLPVLVDVADQLARMITAAQAALATVQPWLDDDRFDSAAPGAALTHLSAKE